MYVSTLLSQFIPWGFFLRWCNVLRLKMVLFAQFCEYTKNHWKTLNGWSCMVCELYLNTAITKKYIYIYIHTHTHTHTHKEFSTFLYSICLYSSLPASLRLHLFQFPFYTRSKQFQKLYFPSISLIHQDKLHPTVSITDKLFNFPSSSKWFLDTKVNRIICS